MADEEITDGDFTFTNDMIRSALVANGYTRNKRNKWYETRNGPKSSVPRDVAFKMLLRDKNLG
jgi:hypothetical protein